MVSDAAEEGYGWIEPGTIEAGRETRAVQQFWEKPDPVTSTLSG
jgi:mannose-1-phosphate guanylyltransferase